MSVYAHPDAAGLGPDSPMGGLPPPGMGAPPGPGDPNSMAMLAAMLQGQAGDGGPGGPPLGGPPPGMDPAMLGGGGLPPELAGGGGLPPELAGGVPGGPGDGGGQSGSDLLSGMNATDHIRAAIKHLMMAMTESTDDSESHGITKGMAALHGLLAAKQKSNSAVTAAGGTPAGG